MRPLLFEFHPRNRVPAAERQRLAKQEVDQPQVIDGAWNLKIFGESGNAGGARVARIGAEVSLALHERIASERATGAAEAARRNAPIVGVVSPGTAGPRWKRGTLGPEGDLDTDARAEPRLGDAFGVAATVQESVRRLIVTRSR